MVLCGVAKRQIPMAVHKLLAHLGYLQHSVFRSTSLQRAHLRSAIHTCLVSGSAPFSSNRTNPDVAPSAIHNVQSITGKWSEKFAEKKIPEPNVSAELIVAHVLGMKTLAGVAPWQIVSVDKTNKIHALCALRLQRMPVQYIIEEWDFRDMVLQVKPPVLIPRPETEDLITHITNYISVHDLSKPSKILDIGCGSGPIVLSLAQKYPLSTCVAIDKCAVACELTSKNANNYALSNVYVEHLELSDRTAQDHNVFTSEYDLIVSNPPYLKSPNLHRLAPEICQYEDVSGALDGGTDGLDIVKAILKNSHRFMSKNSLLWLEVDADHPPLIERLALDNPDWRLRYIKTYKDFLDKPRFCLLSLIARSS